MRSRKRVLYAIIGIRKLTVEVLSNSFYLEQTFNAHPIKPACPKSTELEALSPNHFLLGQHSVNFPSPNESAM